MKSFQSSSLFRLIPPVLCLTIFAAGCSARSEAVRKRKEERTTAKVLAEDIWKPGALTIYQHMLRNSSFLVSAISDSGTGYIAEVKKDRVTKLYENFSRPEGLAMDWRRGHVYVADGGDIQVLKVRKRKKDDKTALPTPEAIRVLPQETVAEGAETPASALSSLSFSVMNRRVYAVEASSSSVWEIDPKKKNVSKLLAETDFAALGHGRATNVYPSNDGKRLYIGTTITESEQPAQAAVLVWLVKKKKLEVFATQPEFKDISRVQYFGGHLLVLDRAARTFWRIGLSDQKVSAINADFSVISEPTDFAVDVFTLAVLDRSSESEKARIVRIPYSLKSKKE